MLPTGDLLERPELDRIDDELFATDYWVPSQRRHRTVLPEPPTVRFQSGPVMVQMGAASPYTEDENGTEIIVLIGLAVLLIVGIAASAIFVVWWI